MLRSSRYAPLLAGASCAFALAAVPQPVSGQQSVALTRAHFGVGYVVNAPEMMAGGGVYVLLPKWGGVGLYLDGKLDISSPEDERGYDPDITASEVENDVAENSFILDEGSWRGFNAALMRPISPFLTVYAGAGVARKTVYSLFNVPNDSNVGVGGVVWAEDPEREETGVNLMGGFMMRMTSRFTAHFGGETKPGGFTAGLSLRLPPW